MSGNSSHLSNKINKRSKSRGIGITNKSSFNQTEQFKGDASLNESISSKSF